MVNNSSYPGPIKLMVVDDEKDILRIIKRDLEADTNSFRVDTFSSSELALQAFDNHPKDYYDLILTDIRMPKINGFELYRRIKEKNPSMKIAFITAFEINKEEFNKVLPSIDVKDFIIKPISMSHLIVKLKSIVNRS
ncbi:MAG TPA: response regulator [Nitrososphaeraceae archaeon]|jgi:YesN/AraC family two-component response regulator|nr:response regulator [Nitrososphaeraceae archaeon]HYZ59967.1 response regulator [Nitrososphaeraceae archaeon]